MFLERKRLFKKNRIIDLKEKNNEKVKLKYKILIFINGNRFLMNKTKINKKKTCSYWRNPDLHLLSQFQYCQVFVGVGVIWFNIPFIRLLRKYCPVSSLLIFYYFFQNFILKVICP